MARNGAWRGRPVAPPRSPRPRDRPGSSRRTLPAHSPARRHARRQGLRATQRPPQERSYGAFMAEILELRLAVAEELPDDEVVVLTQTGRTSGDDPVGLR